jgi:hypothetical protein
MNNDTEYHEIQKQVKILNEKMKNAVTDDDWLDYNTQLNKIGKLIEDYGRMRYNRDKKINILLGFEQIEK